jgi:outer membrane protein OmpA-like peptidoglycan-associated protein
MTSSLRPLSALLLALLAPHLAAQTPAPAPPNGGSLVFQGDTTRAGIGWDSDNDWRGELFHVFREDAGSAWLGELWATSESAGGAKLSYHWRPADAAADAGVRKLFGAIDQNRDHDRKVTLGGGYETERFFASGYLSAGVTGRREAGFSSTSTTQTITGVEPGGRPYEQDITTTVTTRLFERAYDWGVGGRIGHFYPGPLLRVEAGLDYEWGNGSTGQTTLSLGAEKFFAGTPHSIAVGGEVYRKHGGIETDRDDARAWLMYRYSFGGTAWRPQKSFRMVEVPTQQPAVPATPAVAATLPAPAVAATAPATPRVEKRIVKTTASAASDLFFDFDRATLRPDAKAALDAVAARLKAAGFEGNVRVSGHTCDLGPAAYNLRLSQRRASVVRDQLVAAGVPADRILAEGEGEANPRHPNTPSARPKNRRVDIEFVTFVDKVEEVAVAPPPAPVPPAPPVVSAPRPATAPAVEWKQEEIATEPAWLRRALRNPAGHKQSVDVYRTQSESTEVAEGPKRYLNRGPSAQNDAYTVNTDSGANAFAVLANDGDPDGDALSIATVGAPAHGTAVVSGAQVLYTPAPGYAGADAFSYTVSDGRGGTSTATVAVTVVRQNRAPVARDDYAVAGYNTPLAIDVLRNDSDPDGDALVVVSFTQPVNGLVTRGPDNTLVYRANHNYIGYDAFFYEISDGKGGSARAGVTVFADP